MLFESQTSRKPNKYPWTQDIINALWTSHWTANEFNFRSDYNQFYNDLSKEEQQIIIRTLTAIGQIEIAVKRFWADLGLRFDHPSMHDLGLVMGQNEVIHSIAYEKLLDVLQLEDAFENTLKEPSILGRFKYLKKYNQKIYENDEKQFIYALILFGMFIEGTSLFSQFYTILHFNRFDNVLKDCAQQVNYTLYEETLHLNVAITLINTLRQEYPHYFDEELTTRIHSECLESIDHECNIIDWMIGPYENKNLNASILKSFIKNRMSNALIASGFNPIHLTAEDNLNLSKTQWFEETIKTDNMTDFFQKRPTDYTKNFRTFTEEDLF